MVSTLIRLENQQVCDSSPGLLHATEPEMIASTDELPGSFSLLDWIWT